MGYAQFVGRVGALAVALGVTNVVGHPLIAWAEEPSAESSNTDSAPSTGTPSTGTPDKPSETQSPDPTTAPTRDPVDTEDADATDVETGTDVSVVETSDPTTTPAPEVEESTAPEPDVVTDDAPQTKDPHPTETEPAPTATDTDDSPETTDQYRFVAQALAVSGVNEHSLDAPLPMPLAIPVAADLATSSAAPEAAVSITKVDPVTVEEAHPFRSLVLGFLGIFGFDPTPGATNDALLTALWAAYRGYERRFENETPTVSGATIVSTSHTENGYTAVRIAVGFNDPDGDTLHYSTTNGHAGTLTANTDGTFTYLTNTVGTDTVTITANDDDGTGHLHGLLGWLFKPAAGHTRTVTLALNITGSINHAPVGTDDTATTNEDTPVVIHVLTNDTDPDNDPLSIGSFSHGAHGTVTLDGDTLTYTPDQNYNGTDEFSYTTTDGTLASLTTHVYLTITPINDPPVAYDATVHNVSENSTTSATLANLVTDIDHDTLTLEVVDQPELGSVTFITNTGFYYYAPTEFGTATSTTFTYRAFDGTSYSNTATVTIEFVNTNGAPTAADDNLNTDEDTPITIHVLANDTDPDGDPLSIDTHTWINHGSLTLNADGTFTYTPEENYSGSDEFSYTLTDGTTTGNTATVHITVNPVNDAPIGGADTATTDENTAVVITSAQLLANDYDIEGDALTIASVSSAGSGSATLNADGSITFIPEEGFTGIDSFTYRVSDGTAESNDVVVFVTVAPVNDAPVIDSVVSTPGVGNTWVVTVSAHDPDYGDTVTVGLAAIDTAHVGISANPNGSFTVTLTDTAWAAAHPGTQISVTATATDGTSDPVTATMAIGTLNNAIAVGNNVDGQNNIPALPPGLTYTQIAAGAYHTVLLRSDGTAVATGNNQVWQSSIPALPAGLTYTQVAADGFHTVLLRSDGTAFAIGDNGDGQNNIPDLPAGLTYTQIAAGYYDTVLLRSDGTAIAIGNNYYGQNNIPALPAGLTYTQIAAGTYHSVLLLSDGNAIATGYNYFGQASIPALPAGLTYTQVAAGGIHTVLLRSDGTAIATGYNGDGQNNIPDLPAGLTYTQIAAGDYDTVLLRSDGTAIATGYNAYGQTDIPTLPSGVTYTQITAGAYHTVLLTAVGSGPVAV